MQQTNISRRELLQRSGTGFGLVGMAGALSQAGFLASNTAQAAPSETNLLPHFTPKAKRVIFLFMNGGPSHVDTFDPKPMLKTDEGKTPAYYTKGRGSGYMPSPFAFKPRGESGVVMSELLPNLAANCADDMCVIRSMHTDVPNHEPGLLLMNSGNQQPIRPSLGSWLSYGLGSENRNLPAFVVLCPGRPVVGPQLWSSAFLPAEFQGMPVDTNELQVEKLVANLKHPSLSRSQQQEQLQLLLQLNELHRKERAGDDALNAQIRAMEMAFSMQREASDAFDIEQETKQTRANYGETPFGQSCLLARRLAERDVRFIQVYYVTKSGKQPWDTHADNNKRQRELCADSDQATAALITDLRERGLLDDTLIVWGGEFGRTPYAQQNKNKKGNAGRDHHHTGFSMFLAGGGVRGGMMYGNTDEYGMKAIENRVHIHDLHATILHQLGINHEQLTYRYSGRDFRLTDVHGHVVHDILS